MAKNIAVKGCTLSLTIGSGIVQITSPESTTIKADGKGIYSGTINVEISGYTGGTINVPGSGSGKGTLSGTSTKVSISGNKAVLEGDKATVIVNGKMTSNTGPVEAPPVTETVTITSAGQIKVKGE